MNFSTAEHLDFRQYCITTHGSIENLIHKAKNGEIVAQADLGIAYSEGFGDLLPQDIDEAIRWLKTAVDSGYEFPSILETLGKLLDLKGTLPSRRKAYEMYYRGAKLGSAISQINLAEMYRCGVEGVVNRDIKEAFKWYKIAADEDVSAYRSNVGVDKLCSVTMTMGNAVLNTRYKALELIYKYYLEGDCPEGKPQPTKAVHYLTRAAEQGHNEAQLKLGQIYLTGSCEQVKDIARAKRWFRKALAGGDERAKQLLRQCEESGAGSQCAVSQHIPTGLSNNSAKQALEILLDKVTCEAQQHPLTLFKPTAFSEEMLIEFDWSPTAKRYLKAFKLVKEGFEILYKSNCTDEKGISLIAHGFLTECSILQAFPQKQFFLFRIHQLSDRILKTNANFFEGALMWFVFPPFESRVSVESTKVDLKKVSFLLNMINLIKRAEPHCSPCKTNFEFDKNYSSWLHVLYWSVGSLYVVAGAHKEAAEAAENSLLCCPAYYQAKRLLGFSLKAMFSSKSDTGEKDFQPDKFTGLMPTQASNRQTSKHASWTTQKLKSTAARVLKEFLLEAPPCDPFYPNVYYYLADLAFVDQDTEEFKKYYELGQDAEEKRLPFLDPVDLASKDWLAPFYHLLPQIKSLVARCGNKACTRKVKKTELKSCGGCGIQQYCSKDCQKADWKNHKASCKSRKELKSKIST